MGEVVEWRGGIRLSISQIAEEFGMSRATVARRIEQAGIKNEGKRAGYPVYRVRDIVAAIAPSPANGAGEEFDPAKLLPSDRRAWYQSENERLKAEGEMGRLIPAGEVEAEMALVLSIVRRHQATFADRIERDLRPGPEVVEYIERETEAIGRELADALEQADPAELGEDAVRVRG